MGVVGEGRENKERRQKGEEIERRGKGRIKIDGIEKSRKRRGI